MIGRIASRKVIRNSLQIGLRLRKSHAFLEPADRTKITVPSRCFVPKRGVRRERGPQFDFTVRPVEPPTGKMRWHHGNDRVRLVVNPNGLAQNRWIAVKFRLPEPVADDHLELIPPVLFLVGEQSPEQWLDTQDFEIGGGNQPDRALFWLCRAVRD